MDEPTDFVERHNAEQKSILPPEQPLWAKIVAWATIAAGSAYMINPTAGIFELLPDNLPVVGNLDEAAVVFIMFAAMRYLGLRLPEFIEQWTRAPRLPSGDRELD
jgi:uncharacterized membrane protein YkvA (DUF1232 family)